MKHTFDHVTMESAAAAMGFNDGRNLTTIMREFSAEVEELTKGANEGDGTRVSKLVEALATRAQEDEEFLVKMTLEYARMRHMESSRALSGLADILKGLRGQSSEGGPESSMDRLKRTIAKQGMAQGLQAVMEHDCENCPAKDICDEEPNQKRKAKASMH